MLVLGRREQESVVLTKGDLEIRVTLIWAANGNAQIGFDAPLDVVIMRDELLQRKGAASGRGS